MDNRDEYTAFVVPGFALNQIHPMHSIQASKLLNTFLSTATQEAEDRYHKLTFSVMLEIDVNATDTDASGCFRGSIIISSHESLASVRASIEALVGVPLYGLIVVWQSGGDNTENEGRFFSASQAENTLTEQNMFAMLRLMQQRGGVDRLVSEERDPAEPCAD